MLGVISIKLALTLKKVKVNLSLKNNFEVQSLSGYEWEGMWMSVCVSVQIKKLDNFWWSERILMKASGPIQLSTSNCWAIF